MRCFTDVSIVGRVWFLNQVRYDLVKRWRTELFDALALHKYITVKSKEFDPGSWPDWQVTVLILLGRRSL